MHTATPPSVRTRRGRLARAVGDFRNRNPGTDLFDVARCPLCNAPMQAVLGRRGPYFLCRCPPNGSAVSDASQKRS
jgi:hypothetical protein